MALGTLSIPRALTRPAAALLLFALAVFVFHDLPVAVGGRAADGVDLVTPFAVIAAAAAVLAALGARGAALAVAVAVAVAAAVLYVDGHGIHLAANSIGHEALSGEAEDVTHFWDEEFGHIEWHLGWFGLIAAFCLAEREEGRLEPILAAATALPLGLTIFTNTVEGGTWWLALAAAAVFVPWAAARRRRPLLVASAGAFALAAVLIGVWAIWQGDVPQFTEVGWI